jgi:hypothetical protein
VREFAFEQALCAHLEPRRDGILARQLGGSVHGRRVVDVVWVTPGPEFGERVAFSPVTIPPAAIEADVGVGEARHYRSVFPDLPRELARETVAAAVEAGFLERERRNGRLYVRQVARYPDWVGGLVAVENKPDLGRPGDLELQLRKDVSLGLFDTVWLATASHVTGAHLNRLPEAVGVWRFDPGTGERDLVREPTSLDADGTGLEVLDSHPGRTEVRPISAAAKARARVRVAERAYGKGWRVDADAYPDCARCVAGERSGTGPVPDCEWKGRVVDPATECGPECGGYEPADPPAAAPDRARAAATPWDPDPPGRAREQSGLDRFG